AQLRAERAAQPGICGQRGGAVARRGEAADELAVGRLGEGVKRDLVAGQPDGCGQVATRLRRLGERAERAVELLAVALARVVDPVGLEPLQQRLAAALHGGLELTGG